MQLNTLLKNDFIMFILIQYNFSMECHFCFRDPSEAQQVLKFSCLQMWKQRYSLWLIDFDREVIKNKIFFPILWEKNKRNEKFIFLKFIYGENLCILILRLSNLRRAALASNGLDYCLDKYPNFDTLLVWVWNQCIWLLSKKKL